MSITLVKVSLLVKDAAGKKLGFKTLTGLHHSGKKKDVGSIISKTKEFLLEEFSKENPELRFDFGKIEVSKTNIDFAVKEEE